MLSGLKWIFPWSFISYCTPTILGTIASVVGIGSGLNAIFGGGGGGGPSPSTGTTAGGTIYDPFASYRPQFGGQLAAMMGGTSTSYSQPFQNIYGTMAGQMVQPGYQFTSSDPSYAFRYSQGLDAVNRTEAAKGMLGSGNRLMDLMNYGQGMASTEYGNQFNRLMGLSGLASSNQASQFNQLASLAGTSQTMGANYGGLQAQQQQGGWNALAQGLGGLSGMFGGTGFGTGTGGAGFGTIGGEQGAMLASQWA